MQKKCKKMQNYLHMSKKSCTFASDLEIVQIVTIKYNRVMKKECIFKCYAQGEWWYVYGVDYGDLGVRYRIYKGRKWFCHVTFDSVQYAICAAVNAVTVEINGCNYEMRVKV